MSDNRHNPAHPVTNGDELHGDFWGMSKREFAAITILASIMSDPNVMNYSKAADLAICAADDLFDKMEAR